MVNTYVQAKQADDRPLPVLLAAVHPTVIILTGVLAGAILATWLSEVSIGGSAELWIAYHQAITDAYTFALPPIGGLALIAALAALATSWRNSRGRRHLLAAVGCLLLGFIVTVVVHFPINAEIATWQPADPPANWQQFRDRWLTAHAARTVLAVAAFALLVIADPRRRAHAAREAEPQ